MKTKLILNAIIGCMLCITSLYSQVAHLGLNRAAGDQVGYDGLSGTQGPLDIRNDFTTCPTCNIDFYINMVHFLQVLTSGDLNLVQPANSYMINSSAVLWHNNLPDNIYVGVAAGNSTGTGLRNTLIGNSCGTVFTVGADNAFLGWHAGKVSKAGSENVYIGSESGVAATSATGNTFVGFNTGHSITTNGENTFIGARAGYTANGSVANTFVGSGAGFSMFNRGGCTFVGVASGSATTESNNSFFGSSSGTATTLGENNTFIGASAGVTNTVGSGNCGLGYDAGYVIGGLGSYNTFLGCTATYQGGAVRTNVTAIGANCIVPGSNQLILGGNTFGTSHNDVNVGIGLSGDNLAANGLGYEGPAVKLEINADANSFAYTGAGSGLRFRQLTTANAAGANPGLGILTVDSHGDVVYVETIGNYCGTIPVRPLKSDYEIPLLNG